MRKQDYWIIIIVMFLMASFFTFGGMVGDKMARAEIEPEPAIIDTTNTGFYVDKSPLKIDDPSYYDSYNTVIFGDDVGSLTWEDGKMRFEGNAEESAKIFFDYFLKPMVDGYIKSELNKRGCL